MLSEVKKIAPRLFQRQGRLALRKITAGKGNMVVEDSKGAQLEGRQPVREALLANRPINKLFLAKGAKDLGSILDLARERGRGSGVDASS